MVGAADNHGLKQIRRMLFGIVGILILGGAVIWGISNWLFINRAETAQGSVTKLNAGGSHPEITFTTNDGKTIEYPQGGLIFGYHVGDEVIVYYDRENPQNCVINSSGALWGFPALVFVLGLVFVGVALFSRT